MAKEYTENRGLNSLVIRLVGICAMTWSLAEECMGSRLSESLLWFSFTVFAFLLVEGLNNSSNLGMYLKRLLFFAVIAEFPYNLFTSGKLIDTTGLNVMFTLCLGFLACLFCRFINDKLHNVIINALAILLSVVLGGYIGKLINSEFYEYGILIIMMFYVSYNISYPRLFQFALIFLYGTRVSTETVISISINGIYYSIPIVAFCLLATILTWFYNDERGPNKYIIKIAFYLVYPLLLLGFFFLKKYGII